MITSHEADLCRVGIDIVVVDDVRRAIACHGERYLRRVYTECERRDSAGADLAEAASLAARFAAKEAMIKVLRPAGAQPAWTAMEVRRAPDGAPVLQLHGTAGQMADRIGIKSLSVSLTHDGPIAAAVVMALMDTPEGPVPEEAPCAVGSWRGMHERSGVT
jgi:holo-[acyl-carrier protein] synthase